MTNNGIGSRYRQPRGPVFSGIALPARDYANLDVLDRTADRLQTLLNMVDQRRRAVDAGEALQPWGTRAEDALTDDEDGLDNKDMLDEEEG